MKDIEAIRERIRNPDPDEEGIDPADYAEDRENLLEASRIMRRHRAESRGWSDIRHHTRFGSGPCQCGPCLGQRLWKTQYFTKPSFYTYRNFTPIYCNGPVGRF